MRDKKKGTDKIDTDAQINHDKQTNKQANKQANKQTNQPIGQIR